MTDIVSHNFLKLPEDNDNFKHESIKIPDIIQSNSENIIPKKQELTDSQKKAFDIFLTSENMFITGPAGTGKSFLVEKIKKYCKENNKQLLLCAYTGVAAINIGGVTINKLFKVKPGPIIKNPGKKSKLLSAADIIVIDEISMCRIDLFDFVMEKIEAENKRRKKKNKKPIQIVLVGDFAQLPPIIRKNSDEEAILRTKYSDYIVKNNGYCFFSQYWNFNPVLLKESKRQSDQELVKNLIKIRNGDGSNIDFFNRNSSPSETDGIYLYAWKNAVQAKNESELAKLPSEPVEYTAEIEGTFQDSPTEEYLVLKKGCRVMVLINDTVFDRFSNGSLGTVTELLEHQVTVKLDNGNTIRFEPNTWENKKYNIIETNTGNKIVQTIEEEIIGTFTQIPLKLAYAVTIHKSQGQTYDKVNLNPGSFAEGQLYVALSRIKSIDGLHLLKPIKQTDLRVSKAVVDFLKNNNC